MSPIEVLEAARTLQAELEATVARSQTRDQYINATAQAMAAARIVTALEGLTSGP